MRPLNPPILGDFEPSSPYQLSELGLSIAEAHQQFLTRYQRQTENGLWHSLENDGYVYNQLIWHLEKAGKIGEIHQLLREETAEGGNGWYSKCEKEGKTATFIKDVSRAWQLAEADFANSPSQAIALQVRYVLITTSLNSLTRNILPELIAALIKHEIWMPAQGLAYVRQNQDDQMQAEGLIAIAPYLPSTLLPEALAKVREIRGGFGGWLIPYDDDRVLALTGLAPYLPENLLREALAIARAIGDEYNLAEALTGLAPYLPENLLREALVIARAIRDEDDRAEALTGLARYLPEILPEALAAARQIGDQFYHFHVGSTRALTGLVSYLPENPLQEILATVRQIGDEYYCARALTGLAPYLPEILPEALVKARAIRDEDDRAEELTGLATYLTEILPEILPEALATARAIQNGSYRAEALTGLATYLPENLLREALATARAIENDSYRVEVLTELAPYLSENLLREALATARAIGDEYYRAEALAGLAPYLPENLR